MDTNIRLNVKTRDQLAEIGKYGDSMDDIVKRLIAERNRLRNDIDYLPTSTDSKGVVWVALRDVKEMIEK